MSGSEQTNPQKGGKCSTCLKEHESHEAVVARSEQELAEAAGKQAPPEGPRWVEGSVQEFLGLSSTDLARLETRLAEEPTKPATGEGA